MQSYSSQKNWEESLDTLIHENLSNDSFTISELATLMLTSERQLYRNVKDRIGVTPLEYLNHLRFKKAYEYLTNRRFETVRETSKAVGFKDIVYFSRQFKRRFGMLPSELISSY